MCPGSDRPRMCLIPRGLPAWRREDAASLSTVMTRFQYLQDPCATRVEARLQHVHAGISRSQWVPFGGASTPLTARHPADWDMQTAISRDATDRHPTHPCRLDRVLYVTSAIRGQGVRLRRGCAGTTAA